MFTESLDFITLPREKNGLIFTCFWTKYTFYLITIYILKVYLLKGH